MYIDSHAHLYAPEFAADLADVLTRAREAGVEAIVVPGTTVETSRQAVALAEAHEGIYACVGYHPHDANGASREALRDIAALAEHPKVVAIGEIGCDFHYDFSPRDTQMAVFRAQLELAVEKDLPVVVHTRKSMPEAIALVDEMVALHPQWRAKRANPHSLMAPPRGVFHCFSGTAEDAWHLVQAGFSVSYPGIVTFKNSSALETLRKTGYDHILLETDCPWLAPVPHRGKRNEPSFLPLIAGTIAQALDASPEDVARTARFNSKRLFGIGPAERPQIVYKLKNSLYVNITLRCNADCVFCDRKGEAVVKGYSLKIDREPTVGEVLDAIGDPTRYDEIVFCGYGEPTVRLDALKEVSRAIRFRGGRVRLNTNGHGNILNGRDIVPELAPLLDSVSISLNTADPRQYGELMRLDGTTYHRAMIEFARSCKMHIGSVVMTLVDVPEVDIERARALVNDELGLELRVRPYF
jgi:TatD DNase family protein